MLAKTFMIESRGGRRRFKSLNFQAGNLLFWRNHDLLKIFLEGSRKTFDYALTHDLLKIFLGGGQKTFDYALTDDLLKIQQFFGVS